MVPECRHIKTSGGKCGSPALRGKPYCYFHARLKQRAARIASPYLALELPPLEDRGAIQIALGEIVSALADHRLDAKRAGILLYALQIASGNARHHEEIVSANAVSEVTLTELGEEMAPEGATAGPPEQEDLRTLLSKAVRAQSIENWELSIKPSLQVHQSEDLDENWEGEGVSQQNRYPDDGYWN
jgi:hypothetical protein